MADDDDSFPPEVQKPPSEFGFKELKPLKTIQDRRSEYPKIRSSLLAVANIYGYVFVGIPDAVKVYSSPDVLNAGKAGEEIEAVTTIYLRNAPNWIAVNSDNLTLAVCCSGDKGPQILFFDIRNILNKSKSTKTPFCSCVLSRITSAAVSSLHWNPSTEWPNLLAVCLSTGSFHMLSIDSTVKEIAIRPDDFGASAVCWSPKGKQLIIGKNDGTLHQFTPKLEVRRSISVKSVIDRPVRSCDILWLSTFHIAAGYIAVDSDNGDFTQPNIFFANIPSKNEQRDIIWRNYEDPCFGMSETQDPHYFMTYVDQWDLFVLFSSNSTDSAVIAKNKDTQTWEIWTLDDSVRAGLPMSEITQDDSSPVGVAIMSTAKDRIIVDDTRECGPMPVLLLLTNDGVLCPFHMVNLLGSYPPIVTEVTQLSLDGERAMTGIQGAGVGGGDAKQPATSGAKQRLSARPSVRATSTPKPGLNLFHAKSNSTPLPTPIPVPTTATGTAFSTSNLYTGQSRFNEGASILQDLPVSKPQVPSLKESIVPKPVLPALRKDALAESRDSVFDEQNTTVAPGSRDSVFDPRDTTITAVVPTVPPAKPPVVRETPQRAAPSPQTVVVKAPLTKQNTVIPPKLATEPVRPFSSSLPTATAKQAFRGSLPPTGIRFPAESAPPKPLAKTDKQQPVVTAAPPPYKPPGVPAKAVQAVQREAAPKQPHRKSRVSPPSEAMSQMAETSHEMATFEEELRMFLDSPTLQIEEHLGAMEERVEIKREMNDLSTFTKEIKSTTQELGSEVQDAFTALNELISVSSDVERRQKRTNTKGHQSLLFSRPLDQGSRARMKSLRELFQYLNRCIRETNAALDAEWEKMYNRRKILEGKMTGKGRKLDCSDWEKAHQVLSSNLNVLHEQEVRLMLITQQLERLRLDGARLGKKQQFGAVGRAVREPSPFTASANLPLLAENLFSKKGQVEGERSPVTELSPGERRSPASRKKLSPKKQNQLGHALANRKAAPVRTSGHTGPSMIRKPMLRKQESSISQDSSTSESTASTRSKASEMEAPASFDRPIFAPSTLPPQGISRATLPQMGLKLASTEQSTPSSGSPPSTSPDSEDAPKNAGFAPLGGSMQARGSFGHGQFSLGAHPFVTDQPQQASMVPQGSATLAYGAPKSTLGAQRVRNITALPTHFTEAASNLNCPPKVVNIQQLQAPVVEEAKLPEKFEPRSNVPAGAVEVVQAVLNTVKAEKQQKPKEFDGEDKFGGAPSLAASTTSTFMGRASPTANLFTRLTEGKGLQSTAGGGESFSLKLATQSGLDGNSRAPPVFGSAATDSFMTSMRPRSGQVAVSTTYSITPVVQSAPNIASLDALRGTGKFSAPTTQPSPSSPAPKPGLFSLGPPGEEPASPDEGPGTAAFSAAAPPGTDTPPEESAPQTTAGGFSLSQKSASSSGVFGLGLKSSNGGATGGIFGATSPSSATANANKKLTATSSTPVASVASTPPPPEGGAADGGDATALKGKPGLFASSSASESTLKSGTTTTGIGIFGGATTTSTSGIFGGATTTSATGAGIFGAATSTTASGIFGGATTTSETGSGIFGGATTTSTTTTSGIFGGATTTSTSGIFGGATTTSATGAGIFGAATSTTTSGIFGGATTTSTATSGIFGGATTTSTTTTSGIFGGAAATSTTTSGIFGGATTTSVTSSGIFGGSPSPATTTSQLGNGGVAQPTTTPTPVFGSQAQTTAATTSASVFGGGSEAGGSVFGSQAKSTLPTPVFGATTTSATSVFGQAKPSIPTPVFGTPASTNASVFGSPAPAASVFGAQATTAATPVFGSTGVFGSKPSGGSVFGAPVSTSASVFGAQTQPLSGLSFANLAQNQGTATPQGGSVFGGSSSSGFGAPAFGQSAFGTASQKSAFGQSQPASTAQPFGGGFFSGLGGKPAADAANKNPFAVSEPKSEAQAMGGSLFGNSGAKTFGNSAFGGTPQKTFGFGDGAGVGSQGFGGFSKPQGAGSSGFGGAAAFGAAPAFGSPPAFGSAGSSTKPFGGGSFGGGFGSNQSGGAFGQASGGGGFASFAQNDSPGFGNLAQQTGGGFGSFGSPAAQQQQSPFGGGGGGGGFGSNTQTSPSFSGWR